MVADPVLYLEDEILQSAIADVVEVAAYHARHHKRNSGHFSTPRQVFCYVDHLGYIAYGDSSSTNRSVKFIREFFPAGYRPFAELLYSMWRHGTVHQLKPYSYRAPLTDNATDEVEVRWLSTNHNRKRERAMHMLVFPMKDKQNVVYLVVNSCQLADDLIRAVNRMIGDFRDGALDKSACSLRIDSLQVAKNYSDVGKSLAVAVRDQIREAWRQQGGMLDVNGNVVVEHPSFSDLP